jgi:hypothetical protein
MSCETGCGCVAAGARWSALRTAQTCAGSGAGKQAKSNLDNWPVAFSKLVLGELQDGMKGGKVSKDSEDSLRITDPNQKYKHTLRRCNQYNMCILCELTSLALEKLSNAEARQILGQGNFDDGDDESYVVNFKCVSCQESLHTTCAAVWHNDLGFFFSPVFLKIQKYVDIANEKIKDIVWASVNPIDDLSLGENVATFFDEMYDNVSQTNDWRCSYLRRIKNTDYGIPTRFQKQAKKLNSTNSDLHEIDKGNGGTPQECKLCQITKTVWNGFVESSESGEKIVKKVGKTMSKCQECDVYLHVDCFRRWYVPLGMPMCVNSSACTDIHVGGVLPGIQ